jgi:hypothetical protein
LSTLRYVFPQLMSGLFFNVSCIFSFYLRGHPCTNTLLGARFGKYL